MRGNLLRPTAEGWWALALTLGVGAGAYNTGNNLLFLVLALLLVLGLVQWVLGAWNLESLQVERRLPPEIFAFEGAHGALVVRNQRRGMAALSLELRELGAGEAGGQAALVEPGGETAVPVTWTFGGRGQLPLGGVAVSSTFPFGLLRRTRVLPAPGEALVYPARRRGVASSSQEGVGQDVDQGQPRGGGGGDFLGLRPYVAGDPVKDIHWPNSSRFGQAMVVDRARERERQLVIRVRTDAPRLEEELSQACGQVVRHLGWGQSVGLELGERRLPPGKGSGQRRRLLTALALFRGEA